MKESITYWIEVLKRQGLPDGRAAALAAATKDLGLPPVQGFRVGVLYRIIGGLTETEIARLAEQLLSDPVAEEYRTTTGELPSLEGEITIRIGYHPGVTDTVAGTVEEAFHPLQLPKAEQIETGMLYHLAAGTKIDPDDLRTLCEKILANPVIQSYEAYDPQGQTILKG